MEGLHSDRQLWHETSFKINNHRTYAHPATELLKLFTLYLLVRKQFHKNCRNSFNRSGGDRVVSSIGFDTPRPAVRGRKIASLSAANRRAGVLKPLEDRTDK